MKYKHVPTLPDMQISAIGFGCWGISGEDVWNGTTDAKSIRAVQVAVDLGINFFDVAPIYGMGHAETVLGRALKGNRDNVIIASKCGLIWDGQSQVTLTLKPDSIVREVEESLRRLQTDYIDICQMHWPDPDTPVEESMEGLVQLQQAGKIRHIGVTNFSVERTERCRTVAPVATWQGLYNLLEPNPEQYHNISLEYRVADEIVPMVEKHGMGLLPYSPLFQGLLTDSFKPNDNFDENDARAANPKLNGDLFRRYYEISRKLYAFAQEIGRPLAQLAVNWLVAQPSVASVIAGAQTEDHVKQNAGSAEWELTPDMLTRIDEILAPYRAEGLL